MQIDTDTEEGKAELQKLIDKETEGLKKKNSELIDTTKKLKDEMKGFQEKLDAIEADKAKALEEAAAKSGDVEAIKKQLEDKYGKEIDTLKKTLGEKDGLLNQHLIDGGLAASLAKAGVKPDLSEAAMLMLKSKKPEIVDGKAVIEGKPLEAFTTEWLNSEAGQPFKAAPGNSGGGAQGSQSSSKGTGKRSSMSPVEKAEYIDTHGKEAYEALPY